MPISSVYFLGIPDSIIYRRIIGQSMFASTEHVLNVARQLAAQDNSQSALSLLNYGVLTASHIIPGFFSFLGVRWMGWLLFGPTIRRRHQLQRRSEVRFEEIDHNIRTFSYVGLLLLFVLCRLSMLTCRS